MLYSSSINMCHKFKFISCTTWENQMEVFSFYNIMVFPIFAVSSHAPTCFTSVGIQLIRSTWPANFTIALYIGSLCSDVSLNPLNKLNSLKPEINSALYSQALNYIPVNKISSYKNSKHENFLQQNSKNLSTIFVSFVYIQF